MPYEYPMISGRESEQLKQIKTFLFLQTDRLNYNLQNTTPERIWQESLAAVTADSYLKSTESQPLKEKYTALKSLIVSSAAEILREDESISLALSGRYVAKSDFGKYFEKSKVEIDGKSYGISELYSYCSEIEDAVTIYATDFEGYIKRGILDNTGASPVFGLEVGLLKSEYTVDGEMIENKNAHKIRITPGRISFFSSGAERAYIEEDAIYFPKAVISGGSINIAGKFTVTDEGVVTAPEGTIGGWTMTSQMLSSKGGDKYAVIRNRSGQTFIATGLDSLTSVSGAKFILYHDGRLQTGLNSSGKYNFKVDADGNVSLDGTFSCSDGKTKIIVEQGYMKMYTEDSGKAVHYGSLFASGGDGYSLDTKPVLVLEATNNASGIVLLAGTSGVYYRMSYAAIPGVINYYHAFAGSVYFKHNLLLDGRLYTKEGVNLIGLASTLRLEIGSKLQSNDTRIYAPADKQLMLNAGEIYLNSTVTVPYDKGIEFYQTSANSSFLQGIKYGVVSGIEAFYVGIYGKTTYLMGTVRLSGGTAVTSDERLKTDISLFDERHEKLFELLVPRTFKYKDGTSDRTHFGFVAQEVERAITQSALTTQQVAAFVGFEKLNGDTQYSLRYGEFTALNTYMIQKCLEKIKALENEISALKKKG